jgi:hypothetical protein
MRENRPYGLEGGESGSTGLPYPYRRGNVHLMLQNRSHRLPSGGQRGELSLHRLATGGYVLGKRIVCCEMRHRTAWKTDG